MLRLIFEFLLGCVVTFFAVNSMASETWKTELQWKLCEPSAEAVMQKLGVTPLKSKSREIRFFETPDFALLAKGVIIRDRQGKKDERTVKIRLGREVEVPTDWKNVDGFKCEFDVHGSGRTFTCSLETKTAGPELELSHAQRELLQELAPDALNDLDNVERLGYLADVAHDLDLDGVEASLERSTVKGKSFMELSARVETAVAARVQNRIQKALAAASVRECRAQGSNTKAKLALLTPGL